MGRPLYGEDWLKRKQLIGSANKDEHLRLLCQIRHEFTNYEKLILFYNTYPKKRKELNGVIARLIKEGPDYISEFKRKVKSIENYIDLNKKEAKQRFLKEEEERLRITSGDPGATKKILKEWAQNNLNEIIRLNNKHIERKRKKDD